MDITDKRDINIKGRNIVIIGIGQSGAAAGKLAKRLSFKEKKKVLLVSVDIHRTAAIANLKKLSK